MSGLSKRQRRSLAKASLIDELIHLARGWDCMQNHADLYELTEDEIGEIRDELVENLLNWAMRLTPGAYARRVTLDRELTPEDEDMLRDLLAGRTEHE